tara:strand:+ start:240 stop:455 length:216 start_codon:yes stop_codon:yes gene_type:complete
MRLLLVIILVTQVGCSFVMTAAGSFVGNLGAELVEEEVKEMIDTKETSYCDPMGVRNCPKEKEDKCQKDST